MANFAYQEGKLAIIKGEIDFQEAGDDIRFAMVMTATTFDTETTIQYMGDATTPDYYDGAGASANGEVLDTQTTTIVSGNARFDAANEIIASLAAGTTNCQALVFFKWVTSLALSPILFYIDSGTNIPFNGSGGQVTFEWSSSGIMELS